MSTPRTTPSGVFDAADVVIVGSGMGGGTLAWGLAERGVSVLVLERGDYLPQEAQNWSPESVFVDRRYKPSEKWRDESGSQFAPGVHYVVGGNTKVYGASLPRLRERDFERTDYAAGVSPAWPMTYAELEPYYAQAEDVYRVHGTEGEDPSEPWRSGPFPYPALTHEPYVARMLDRLRQAGVNPSANCMGVDLRAGGACVRCSTCDGFPCRVQAKSDAQTCALQPALATGYVRILTNTRVTRVETSGRRVTGVQAIHNGESVFIAGGVVVLSAGAVNSAALLLGSANDEYPEGLANSTGLVGRNYMVHNNTHIAAIDALQVNDVVFQKTAAINDFYHDLGDGYPGGTIQLIGKVQASMMKTHATKVPLAILEPMARRSVEWLVMSEDLPSRLNRIYLDEHGQITVSWARTNYDRHELLLAKAKELLHNAGYKAIFEQRFGIDMNSHMCGTAVAGRNPQASVLDPWCRAHDLENLFVVDSSFFPSSGAQNPALTIAAQALRVAQEVEWNLIAA